MLTNEELEKSLIQLQKTVDNIENDLISDRSEIETIKNKLDRLESLLKGLESRLPRTEAKISDAVARGVSEGTQELTDHIEELTKDKIIMVEKKSNLWNKIFGKS